MSDAYNYRELNHIARQHYARYCEVLGSFITRIQQPDLKMIDLGCGGESVLLRAVCDQIDASALTHKEIHIHFMDGADLPSFALADGEPLIHRNGATQGQINYKQVTIHWRFTRSLFQPFWEEHQETYHLIAAHAAYHEFLLTSRMPQDTFANLFFDKIPDRIKPGGYLVMGDPYYPPYVSQQQVQAYIDLLSKIANHADPPHAFTNPETLLGYILNNPKVAPHVRLAFEEERYQNIPSQPQMMGRKYFTLALERESY